MNSGNESHGGIVWKGSKLKSEVGVRADVVRRSDRPREELWVRVVVPEKDPKTGKTRKRYPRHPAETSDLEEAITVAREYAVAYAAELVGQDRHWLEQKYLRNEPLTDSDAFRLLREQTEHAQIERERAGKEPKRRHDLILRKLRIIEWVLDQAMKGPQPLDTLREDYLERYVEKRRELGRLKNDGSMIPVDPNEWNGHVRPSDREKGRLSIEDSTLRLETKLISQAFNAVRRYRFLDARGRGVTALPINPCHSKRGGGWVRIPELNTAPERPHITYEEISALLNVADEFDTRHNVFYRGRGFVLRPPHSMETLLVLARETWQRRGSLAKAQFSHWVRDPEEMAEWVNDLLRLGGQATSGMVEEAFPFGIFLFLDRKNQIDGFVAVSSRLAAQLEKFAAQHPGAEEGIYLFPDLHDPQGHAPVEALGRWFNTICKDAGLGVKPKQAWQAFRRLGRSSRFGHFPNVVVALHGGWTTLDALHHKLDVDMRKPMNRAYLRHVLVTIFGCAEFDASVPGTDAERNLMSAAARRQLEKAGYMVRSSLDEAA